MVENVLFLHLYEFSYPIAVLPILFFMCFPRILHLLYITPSVQPGLRCCTTTFCTDSGDCDDFKHVNHSYVINLMTQHEMDFILLIETYETPAFISDLPLSIQAFGGVSPLPLCTVRTQASLKAVFAAHENQFLPVTRT